MTARSTRRTSFHCGISGQRRDFGLHWDGLNTSLTEIVLNSGIGNGASAKSIDLPSLERIRGGCSI